MFDEVRVAPRTTWGVARVQQEFGAEGSTVSLMVTGVHRELDAVDPLAMLMPRSAVTVNGETFWRLGGSTYEVSVNGGLSRVEGDEEAILRLQHASTRYFQRPERLTREYRP